MNQIGQEKLLENTANHEKVQIDEDIKDNDILGFNRFIR